MLLSLFWIVIGLLLGLTVMQLTFVWMYGRILKAPPTPPLEGFSPDVAVILCVRGEDPTLMECLTGLSMQSYSKFQLHVVADNADDPALEIVNSFLDNPAFAKKPVVTIFEPAETRTLKCSALIHTISNLEKSVEVVALVDADVVADPDWLRDLIAPLADDAVGVSTGNRWFDPKDKNLGSLIRQAWNAGAVPQMTLYEIPWGGSLALSRDAIEKCNLLAAWGNAFCEDTMLSDIMSANDLKIVRVPNLIVANQESNSWGNTLEWIKRQLITVRLHHKNWPLVFVHGLMSGLCVVGAISVGILMLIDGSISLGLTALISMVVFQLINMGLLEWIRSGNEKIIASRNVVASETRVSIGTRFLIAILTQWAYFLAIIKAAFAKRVTWRGIDYRIGKKSIELVEYRPFGSNDRQLNGTLKGRGENASID